ncbi:MAG: phosphatidate cytidylyltransferase [Phycisphaerae bacterium]|nr:phosphatidate cytidylyltransferase [Phycisphaerae bacterium]
MIKSKVGKRLFFGSIMVGSIAGLLTFEAYAAAQNYFGMDPKYRGLFFAIILSLVALGGTAELAKLAAKKSLNLCFVPTGFAIIAIILCPFWAPKGFASEALAAALMAGMFLMALNQGLKKGTANTINNLAAASLAMIYLGLGSYFIISIRCLGASADSAWPQIQYVVMFLATVKCADIGAYFTGRAIGKHKWVPSISPAKTWEGLAGGIALSIIIAIAFAKGSGIMSVGNAIIFGAVLAIVGQLGDLLESMFKRDADLKDSASMIPEFGGFLDLIDSPVVASPIGLLLFKLLTC